MAKYGYYSILGQNIKFLTAKYDLNPKQVEYQWKNTSLEQDEKIRLCAQIKELCYMRDTRQYHILSINEIKDLIDNLCTE